MFSISYITHLSLVGAELVCLASGFEVFDNNSSEIKQNRVRAMAICNHTFAVSECFLVTDHQGTINNIKTVYLNFDKNIKYHLNIYIFDQRKNFIILLNNNI